MKSVFLVLDKRSPESITEREKNYVDLESFRSRSEGEMNESSTVLAFLRRHLERVCAGKKLALPD